MPPIKRQPNVLSDKKAEYWKDVASTYIEHKIVWWYGPGWDSNTGRNYLLSKLKRQYWLMDEFIYMSGWKPATLL